MKTSKTLTLINSEFDSYDAWEIVSHMIESKINFHAIRNLSSQERFGHIDQHSVDRMRDLRESLMEFKEMTQKARKEGLGLKIFADFTVEFTELEADSKHKELARHYN